MNFSQGLEPTAILNYENVFILLETRINRGNRDRKTAVCIKGCYGSKKLRKN